MSGQFLAATGHYGFAIPAIAPLEIDADQCGKGLEVPRMPPAIPTPFSNVR